MKTFFYATLITLCAFGFTSCDDEDDGIGILNGDERDELVDTYADRYLARELYPAVTTRLEDFDQEDAYDFQEDLIDELEDRGEEQSGYKLGFTGDAPLPFGAPEALYGTLFESQRFESGATIDISETFAAGNAGVEFGLIISRDAEYETSDFPLSDDELRGLIASVAPLSEFPEIAFEEGPDNINYLDLIASNAGARAYVIGTPVALSDLDGDIDEIAIRVFKDDVMISEGISGDALGSQLNALEFLLLKLAEVDQGVEEGQLIATGSLGSDLPLEVGTYRIEYNGLGVNNFTLVE